MEIQDLRKHWNAFGRTDPLWAILTAPGKRGGGWDLDEFLATGPPEVAAVLDRLAALDVPVHRGRALDFGCGVGRLTQALAEHFDSCDGIDIASSMIERARELNRHGDRCRFHLNETADLRVFEDETFDFVLSLIVLQHMEPHYIRSYLREFMRVLRPGGVAFFNVPTTYLFGTELPAEAKRASLQLVESLPALMPRAVVGLRVIVTNRSPIPWPRSARLLVANHWRHGDGTMLTYDDGRTMIEDELRPGEAIEMSLDVTAPAVAGDYELEVDLLQEQIGWFADFGGSTLRVPLTVISDESAEGALGPSADDEIAPTMEMYTMDEAEVVAELERAGGVVFDVREEDRCGPSIASLDYVVAKSAALEGASEPAADDIDPLATSVADALEAGHRQRVADTLAEIARLDGVRLDGSPRTRAALEMLRNRANLLGFALTSDRGAVGRASVVVRRVLRRLMVQVLHRQSEFNRAGAELIDSMLMELSATRKLVDAQREMIGSSEARIEQLERARSAASAGQAKLRQRLARAELRYAALRRSIIGANGTVELASSEAVPEAPDIDYLSLTNRFRGSTAEIRRRQEGYLRHFADVANVVDIGCGRGEFLQLLREHGVSATGVDVEESMVAECERLGLDAVLGDGIAYLESTPEASLGGIFAAQVIEHLSTNDLVRLVRVGFSRLRPGGVMLLETVNPTALITFSSFYADFTHNRPVHPQAVQWLAESAGFEAEIEYVSPVSDDRRLRSFGAPGVDPSAMAEFNRGIALANDLLFGYQEYALVARKPG